MLPDLIFGATPGLSTLGLANSVGLRGKNVRPDVIRVQDALNAIPAHEGAPEKLLTLDGIAGPKTCNAIQLFQLKHFGWSIADGRVDPGGKTEKRMADLLGVYGTTLWNIRRVEASRPAPGNVVRTVNSGDRFFAIGDPVGARRVLYYFMPLGDTVPKPHEVPPLRERPEFNTFNTAVNCGVFSFVGDATYSEFSPTSGSALIQINLLPECAHISDGRIALHIRHEWLEPMSTPGARLDLAGALVFVRDETNGPRKTPRR